MISILYAGSCSCRDEYVTKWKKKEVILEAHGSDTNSRLQLTTSKRSTIWLDQVSAIPLDTHKVCDCVFCWVFMIYIWFESELHFFLYFDFALCNWDCLQGHGFRQDLFDMLAALKPGFIRFPGTFFFFPSIQLKAWREMREFNHLACFLEGGSFVEGDRLMNAFRWRETIGTWEERPGHFNDVWQYWTDDGLGFFEFLQVLPLSPLSLLSLSFLLYHSCDSIAVIYAACRGFRRVACLGIQHWYYITWCRHYSSSHSAITAVTNQDLCFCRNQSKWSSWFLTHLPLCPSKFLINVGSCWGGHEHHSQLRMLCCRTLLTRLSLLGETRAPCWALSEQPWAIHSLLIWNMLLLGIKTAGTRTIAVCLSEAWNAPFISSCRCPFLHCGTF